MSTEVIPFLLEQAKSNQILVGGVGTVLFGSLMYLVRGIPMWCYYTTKRILTIDLSMTTEHALYTDVLATISTYRISFFARNYTTANRGGKVVAGYGYSYAFYKGRLVTFRRSIMRENLNLYEELNITLFTRKVSILQDLVKEAVARPEDIDVTKLWIANGQHWDTVLRKRRRLLSTVFTNGNISEQIIERIRWFLANEQWYLDRGIPYKLIFLLYGPPGTGKTSLIYAVASELQRNLYYIQSIANMAALLGYMDDGNVAVMEDIDLLADANREAAKADEEEDDAPKPKRKSTMEQLTQKAVLHKLLNTLDGPSTPHGLIMFITTNHKDLLDPALIRPGRIDYKYEMGPLDAERTFDMFVAFYGGQQQSALGRYIYSRKFISRTAAELQVLFMTHVRAEDALRELENYVESAEQAKPALVPQLLSSG